MKIEPFVIEDLKTFLELASAENWVAEAWEFEFLLSQFPEGCFTARGDQGETVGFITSLRHDRSGWIGNLIVGSGHRGKGIGEALFRKTLETVIDCGVETVWLTASKAGQPLYQKFGFNSIDTIIRWSGNGKQRYVKHETGVNCREVDSMLGDIDCRSWGDQRLALISATAGRGELLRHESGFVVLQPCGDTVQIGPFSALTDGTADSLLEEALHKIPIGTKICLDAPASNRAALRLFNRKRMRISGSNELMYAGVKPEYRPEYVYGLASMGSCG